MVSWLRGPGLEHVGDGCGFGPLPHRALGFLGYVCAAFLMDEHHEL